MNRIAKYAAGIAILKEWLGKKGIPVESTLAEDRAQTCLKCRLNAKKTLWDQLSYHIAKRILQHVRLKNNMGLKVSCEKELGTCKGCLCHLPLKVWVPMEHIEAHMKSADYDDLDVGCWIRKETHHS
jgi:hypothetical protein